MTCIIEHCFYPLGTSPGQEIIRSVLGDTAIDINWQALKALMAEYFVCRIGDLETGGVTETEEYFHVE